MDKEKQQIVPMALKVGLGPKGTRGTRLMQKMNSEESNKRFYLALPLIGER